MNRNELFHGRLYINAINRYRIIQNVFKIHISSSRKISLDQGELAQLLKIQFT